MSQSTAVPSTTDASRAAAAPQHDQTADAPVAAAAVATSAASAARCLSQLDHTIFLTEVSEWSVTPAETTTSGRRSVALKPAAHVPTLRRGGALLPKSAWKIGTRSHQRRHPIRIRHHLQELMSRSLAPAPLPRGHHVSPAMGARLLQGLGPHHFQPVMYLYRRCRHHAGPTDHHRRRLPWTLTGVLHPGIPRPSRCILCRQASLQEVLFRVIRVRTVLV